MRRRARLTHSVTRFTISNPPKQPPLVFIDILQSKLEPKLYTYYRQKGVYLIITV